MSSKWDLTCVLFLHKLKVLVFGGTSHLDASCTRYRSEGVLFIRGVNNSTCIRVGVFVCVHTCVYLYTSARTRVFLCIYPCVSAWNMESSSLIFSRKSERVYTHTHTSLFTSGTHEYLGPWLLQNELSCLFVCICKCVYVCILFVCNSLSLCVSPSLSLFL